MAFKKVYIIRHAKSSWDNLEQKDIDRPLNDRGVRDAYSMTQRLLSSGITFDAVFSSNGIRALHTATLFTKELNLDFKILSVLPQLYHAPSSVLLETLQKVTDSLESIAIFAHNPGITDFAWKTGLDAPNIPTCGILSYEVEIENWKDVRFEDLVLKDFDYPKK